MCLSLSLPFCLLESVSRTYAQFRIIQHASLEAHSAIFLCFSDHCTGTFHENRMMTAPLDVTETVLFQVLLSSSRSSDCNSPSFAMHSQIFQSNMLKISVLHCSSVLGFSDATESLSSMLPSRHPSSTDSHFPTLAVSIAMCTVKKPSSNPGSSASE